MGRQPDQAEQLQTLLDRAAISDIVIQYATAVDARDWPLYAACFTPTLYRDFSDFAPGVVGSINHLDWAAEVSQTLPGFDATQHSSTNHRHDVRGDEATCISNMTAEHIYIEGGKSDSVTLGGAYTNTLLRTAEGWKISQCVLKITWTRGNLALFEKAVARAQKEGLAWKRPN
jgi:hypothetical protein